MAKKGMKMAQTMATRATKRVFFRPYLSMAHPPMARPINYEIEEDISSVGGDLEQIQKLTCPMTDELDNPDCQAAVICLTPPS